MADGAAKQESRRSFFLSLGTAAAGAATLAATRRPAPQPVRKTDPSTSAYRVTDHVRHYYRTAKV